MRDRALFGGLGVLVVVLGAIFFWSKPKVETTPTPGVEHARDDDDELVETAAGPTLGIAHATSEFAVLTNATAEEAAAATSRDALAEQMDERYCGAACDVVRATILDPKSFEIEVTTAGDYILPPRDTLDVVGRTLDEDERTSIPSRSVVVVLRAHGVGSREQRVARTGFATALAAAERTGGLIYDESTRRIENARTFRSRRIVSPPFGEVFEPTQIVVQLYAPSEGVVRALTLGMERFAAPDLSLRGASTAWGNALALVANAVAKKSTLRNASVPVTIDPADVQATSASARPVKLAVARAERTEGDPVNVLVELTPEDGASWDVTLAKLFGSEPAAVAPSREQEEELERIAKRARRDLSEAWTRRSRGEGRLFVKGPFRSGDAGPTEWMWIEATSCNPRSCSGRLSSQPTALTSLAPGDDVVVIRAELADWQLRMPDGGALGGASITTLSRVAAPR